MMDLGQFSSDVVNTPVTMEVLHPSTLDPLTTATGEPVTLEVVGIDSDKFREVDKELLNKRLKKTNKTRKVAEIDADQVEAETNERLAACVIAVHNISVNGEEITANRKSVLKMLKALPFLRRQLEDFINDQSNFFKVSSTTSTDTSSETSDLL